MGYNSSTLGVCSMSTVSKPVFLQIYHAFKRVFYCTSGRGDILHNFYFHFHFRVFSIDLHLFLFSLTSLRLLFRFILITLEFIIFLAEMFYIFILLTIVHFSDFNNCFSLILGLLRSLLLNSCHLLLAILKRLIFDRYFFVLWWLFSFF